MTRWTVDCLQDRDRVGDFLREQGLVGQAAAGKAELFARCAAALSESGVSLNAPAFACFVPGRIEVLGKHTDYAGGRSMVAAVDKGFCVVAAERDDRSVNVVDVRDGGRAEFLIGPDCSPQPGHWSNYPMTVARRIARNFPGDLRGADVALASDLPAASGMSSSSALIVSSFLALSAVNRLASRDLYKSHIRCREDLAGYLGTIENGQTFGELAGDAGVGTFGGSQDHTAILCARPGHIVQYSYCPVRFERAIALSDDLMFVVAFSGVLAEKTGPARELYNRVSRRAAAAMELWREHTGRDDAHFAAALRSSRRAADRFRDVLRQGRHPDFDSSDLYNRFDQFYSESEETVPAVADSLVGPAVEQFGELVDHSMLLATQCLGNQVPETVFLAKEARALGAAAASAFGAGFGGSVWALVRADRADAMMAAWRERYERAFPRSAAGARFFTSRPGPGAFVFDGDIGQ